MVGPALEQQGAVAGCGDLLEHPPGLRLLGRRNPQLHPGQRLALRVRAAAADRHHSRLVDVREPATVGGERPAAGDHQRHRLRRPSGRGATGGEVIRQV